MRRFLRPTRRKGRSPTTASPASLSLAKAAERTRSSPKSPAYSRASASRFPARPGLTGTAHPMATVMGSSKAAARNGLTRLAGRQRRICLPQRGRFRPTRFLPHPPDRSKALDADLLRGLVLAQALEGAVANHALGGQLAELDLGD